jgi:hypothetical protein
MSDEATSRFWPTVSMSALASRGFCSDSDAAPQSNPIDRTIPERLEEWIGGRAVLAFRIDDSLMCSLSLSFSFWSRRVASFRLCGWLITCRAFVRARLLTVSLDVILKFLFFRFINGRHVISNSNGTHNLVALVELHAANSILSWS